MTDLVLLFRRAENIAEHVHKLHWDISSWPDLLPDRAPGLNCVFLRAASTEPDHLLADNSITPVAVNQMKCTGTKKLFTALTLRDCTFEHVYSFQHIETSRQALLIRKLL